MNAPTPESAALANVPESLPESVRVAIVGAGFSGLAMSKALRDNGNDDFVVLEMASGVGGTWRHNTYPGCACDVPSRLYSLSFAPNPEWTRSFSGQAEILAYLESVADKFDLRRFIHTSCAVTGCRWDEGQQRWIIETTKGTVIAQSMVFGAGALHEPSLPDIPGLSDFPGDIFHSARWNHDVSLEGKRVAVVGTGASAIQIIPSITPQVSHLTVFQRTPPWVLPRGDRTFTRLERLLYRHVPLAGSIARYGIYAFREAIVPGLTGRRWMLRPLRRAAQAHLRAQVSDPALRKVLTPTYELGCKRMLLSNDYYPALARSHVDVVPAGLSSVEGSTLIAADGSRHDVDAIVLATGFEVTNPPWASLVHLADGSNLRDKWHADGGAALRGTGVAGVPNLFVLAGPNTGIGHTSLVLMIESQVKYVMQGLAHIARTGAAQAPTAEATDAFNNEVQRRLGPSVWNAGGCSSWYLHESGRNMAIWPGSVRSFRQATARFDPTEHTAAQPAAGARSPEPSKESVGR